MRTSVVLTWDDDEGGDTAGDFIKLADELIEWGYLGDADQDALAVIVSKADVSRSEAVT